MIRLAALAAVVLTLAGCEPMTPEQAKARAEKHPASNVTVVHDDTRAATCWTYNVDRGGGISCLPDWMLTHPTKAAEDPVWPTGKQCNGNPTCVALDKRRRAFEAADPEGLLR